MKKLLIAAALGATALSGAAVAQLPPPPPGEAAMRGDLNGDGVVTRDEAIAEADQRFAALDLNHDGKVTRDEMRAAREARRDARMADRGDMPPPPRGGDMPPPPPGADGAPPPPGDHGFDGSGGRHGGGMMRREMTQQDFRDRALRMFDRMDTNHDGRIDRNEREAARLLMRARMSGDAPPPPAGER